VSGKPPSFPNCSCAPWDRLQEVWTCSEYCRSIFARYHPKVARIPHVNPTRCEYSTEDLDHVKRLISYREPLSYFLLIAALGDRRKNTEALISAFCRLAARMPEARLILKSTPGEQPAALHPGIIYINDQLSDAQITALYELAFAYVSPHHSKAGG